MSSGEEAEGYALGSGACEGLFICAVAIELGVELKLAVHSDSTAAISQHTKMGLGRMKHVELRFLFVKDFLKRERLTLCKIPGTENPADLGTKVLEVDTHRHLCSIIGLGACETGGGGDKGSHEEFAIHWKRWTPVRAERPEITGYWTGAMGTRNLDVNASPRAADLMLWCGLKRLVRPTSMRDYDIPHETEVFRTRVSLRALKTDVLKGCM